MPPQWPNQFATTSKIMSMKKIALSSIPLLFAIAVKGYRLESIAVAGTSTSPLRLHDDGVPRALSAGRTDEGAEEYDNLLHSTPPQTSFAEDGDASVVPVAAPDSRRANDAQQIATTQKKPRREVPLHVSEMKELASVVKIFVDTVKADFVSPWQMMAPKEHSGSGFVVEGQMIMTNAHLVANQTRVLVRKHGNPKRFLAKVIAVCHECDLALVTVDDEVFWRGLQPLAFGGVPQLRETVVVLGYPTGGDQLSITEGVVSRVGVSIYAHSYLGLLTVQIDAPINPGNSGGPAISGGKVVGVAFQGFSEMQNVGYIVPFPVIRHFLNDIALHRRHTGIVSMGIKAQAMENEALKQFKGLHTLPPEALPENVTASGVLVVAVDKLRSNLYMQGKIALPISRYEQLPEERGNCEYGAAVPQPSPPAAAADSETRACRPKKTPRLALVEEQPAAEADDSSAQQRDVKEVPARVIWQPENWKPSRPPSACTRCSSGQQQLSLPTLSGERMGALQDRNKTRGSAASAPVSTDLQRNHKEHRAKSDATKNENDTDSEGSAESQQEETRQDEQNQATRSNSPDLIDVHIAIHEVKLEGEITNAETEPTRDEAAAQSGEFSRANKEESELPSSSRSAAKGIIGNGEVNLREEGNKLDGQQQNGAGTEATEHHSLDNPGSHASPTITAPTAAAETAGAATAVKAATEEKDFLSARTKLESLLHKLLGSRSTLHQIRSLLRNSHDRETKKNDAIKLNKKPVINESDTAGNETEAADPPAAAKVNKPTYISSTNTEQQQQQQHQQQGGNKERNDGDAAQQQGANQQQHAKQSNAPDKLPKEPGKNKEKTDEKDVALASPVRKLVENPYFDPRLLEEEEFLGFQEGDVILSIGKYNVADDGTVSFRNLERVAFSYVITEHFNGQNTWAYVLRDGRVIKVTVPLMTPNFKVAPFTWDTRPSYFVYGGFVFTPLSKVLLTAKLRTEVPNMFEYFIQRLDYQEEEGDEFVVLSLILASEISVGYEQPPSIVRRVNGKEIRNMKDLVREIEATKERFVELQVEASGAQRVLIAIDRHKAQTSQQKILAEHNIAQERSVDLVENKQNTKNVQR